MSDSFISLPEETYAIIVGINGYGKDIEDLTCPCHDAINFSEFLTSNGVPQDNINLFLSPMEGRENEISDYIDEKVPGFSIIEATAINIENAILECLSAVESTETNHQSLFWFYWSGHGAMASEGSHSCDFLFFQDTNRNEGWNSLNVEHLIEVMHTSSLSRVTKQIFIIDACRGNFQDIISVRDVPGHRVFHSGKYLKDIKQFRIYATQLGDYAVNKTPNHSDEFSTILLEGLRKYSKKAWPPSMKEVTKNLKNVFKERKLNQTPVCYSIDWDSDGELILDSYKFSEASSSGTDAINLLPSIRLLAEETIKDIFKTEFAFAYRTAYMEYLDYYDFPDGINQLEVFYKCCENLSALRLIVTPGKITPHPLLLFVKYLSFDFDNRSQQSIEKFLNKSIDYLYDRSTSENIRQILTKRAEAFKQSKIAEGPKSYFMIRIIQAKDQNNDTYAIDVWDDRGGKKIFSKPETTLQVIKDDLIDSIYSLIGKRVRQKIIIHMLNFFYLETL